MQIPATQSPPAREPATWRIFSPDGELVARLSTPPEFDIEQVGADWVLGVWRDELDVESVRLYRLMR